LDVTLTEGGTDGEGQLQKKPSSGEGAEEDDDEWDFENMSIVQAFCEGFLYEEDYATIGAFVGFLGCLILFGNIVAMYEEPWWLGHAMWVGMLIIICSICPIIKYFHVYQVTWDMYLMGTLFFGMLWGSGLALFTGPLAADVNDYTSLMLLSVCVMYPCFLCLLVTFYKWWDDNWEITPFIVYSFPICFFFIAAFIFQMYIWEGSHIGGWLTVLLVLTITVIWFLRAWIMNEMYLPPYYQKKGNQLMASASFTAIAVAVVFDVDLFYFLSIGFFFIIVKFLLNVVGHEMTRRPDSMVFFSPYIFPVYSYDPHTDNLIDENGQIRNLFVVFIALLVWGVLSAMFTFPIGVGVSVAAAVLVVMALVSATLISITPVQMGIAARFVTEPMLKEAAQGVKSLFAERRRELKISCKEWVEKDKQEAQYEAELKRLTHGGGASKKGGGGGGADDLLAQMHAMFGDDISDDEGDAGGDGPEAEEAPGVPKQTAAQLAWNIEDSLYNIMFEEDSDGRDVRRFDSILNFVDALVDTIRGGHGPFGFVSLGGVPYKLYSHFFKPDPNSKYNPDGTRKVPVEDPPLVDTKTILVDLWSLDEQLSQQYHEEMRAIIHFQLLVMVAAQARLAREGVLFQKFLRENRFKLMSNGINPPKDIFKTHSYASINIALVAVWLLSLTPEERERFHELKSNFTEEISVRDMMMDDEDAQAKEEHETVRARMKRREEIMCRRRYQDFQARRLRRQEHGTQPEGAHDEVLLNAEEALLEIESGWSCRPGMFGRALQFQDPDFLPEMESIGGSPAAREIVDWRMSTAININAGLFDAGTDPDDVHQGVFADGWLLSALSIVAASGGVDDDKVDRLIDNLFITKTTSATGAYAIKLHMNAQWESVICDDYFPVLDNQHKSEDCNGAACAYSKGFKEMWVPLIEKAFAKYYGGYAAIEEGTVMMGLSALTGGESEEIFLGKESRGAHRTKLWDTLIQYQRNKFLMGAGTVAADNADREIQESGLVFGACYVIYAVRQIDGIRLIKLRNPPGDHAEWMGDWGDLSPLWTRRLKHKLGWSDEDDNTFWMSFDDFTNAFRSLYVCKYYDPERWPKQVLRGEWKEGCNPGLPCKHNPDCEVDSNPQYQLRVDRPTEVCLTLTQVDEEDLAPPDIHPIALYLCSNVAKDRAMRVSELNTRNVVARSGDPVREREVRCYCTLEPRTYTLLCGTYLKEMDGPFKLEVQANFPVQVEQIWPALWKEKGPETLVEKLANKAAKKAEELKRKVEEKAQEQVDKLKEKHKDKIDAAKALVKGEDATRREDEEVEQKEKEKEEEERKKQEEIENCPWVKVWDPNQGKYYYYNTETSISVWDEPAGFVEGVKSDDVNAATSIQAAFRGKQGRKKNKKKKEKPPCKDFFYDASIGSKYEPEGGWKIDRKGKKATAPWGDVFDLVEHEKLDGDVIVWEAPQADDDEDDDDDYY